uniref:FBA_2 domain-containing protein n=1 Tax=Steinernema glaseri TaxID=37863 RepID=A0A1I7Y6A3_9BILA
MDSVQFSFCLGVMGSLSVHEWNYENMAKVLTGRWKAAAKRYADNVYDVALGLYHRDGEWYYWIDGDGKAAGLSLEQLLLMNRRFLRCQAIHIGRKFSEFGIKCSKKEIFTRLLPFMVQQPRSFRILAFYHELNTQDTRMYFNYFLNCRGLGFQSLRLTYFGQETVDFLSKYLDHNVEHLYLDTAWPQSQSLEDLIVKFFSAGNKRRLVIMRSYVSSVANFGLTMSPKILKAICDAWDHSETRNYFRIYVPWNSDLESVRCIPVPLNVTRTESKEDDESRVVWTKENGSTLSFSFSLSWISNT